MKQNYDLIMEKEIEKIVAEGRKPKLLLHSCCAPCSCAVIEFLLQYFELTIYFYNPNITFEAEYRRRLEEQIEYHRRRGYDLEVIEGRYNPKDDFFAKVRGLENSKEGGARCHQCYGLRLEATAEKAKELGFEYFTSALSISPKKNSQWINELGEKWGEKYGVKFLNGDFKKKNRYLRGVNITKEYDLYRQDYCGCAFSRAERKQQIRAKERMEEGKS